MQAPELLRNSVEAASFAIEAVAAAIILLGAARAVWGYASRWFVRGHSAEREHVRLDFGKQLVLALEFQVAADLLKVAVEPTLDALIVAGAVVAIRTVLNFFLDREVAALEARLEDRAAGGGAGGLPAGSPQRPPAA